MTTSKPVVFLNGEFLPLDQARVSVLDRGFLFGDGVYEVIPAYGGKPFRLEQHLERLNSSLVSIRIPSPYSIEQWSEIIHEVLKRNRGEDQSVYLQLTRGVAPRDHAFPPDIRPTVFIMSNPLIPVDPVIAERGVRVVTLEDIRWKRCNIKAITLLANVMLKQEALDQEAMEAVLVRDGHITEGSASNVFIVKDNTLITPPKSSQLLPGVTRDLVLELARDNGVACEELEIPFSKLKHADEVWLSSSTKEILPVTHVDDLTIGDGHPGPLWRKMIRIYQKYKEKLRQN